MKRNKKTYQTPEIKLIPLDKEISMILQSAPPFGPDEMSMQSPDFFKNDAMYS